MSNIILFDSLKENLLKGTKETSSLLCYLISRIRICHPILSQMPSREILIISLDGRRQAVIPSPTCVTANLI